MCQYFNLLRLVLLRSTPWRHTFYNIYVLNFLLTALPTKTFDRKTTAIETLPTERTTVSSTTLSSSSLLTRDVTTRTEPVTSQEHIVTTTGRAETSQMSVSQVTQVTYPETSFITSQTRVSEVTTIPTIPPTPSKSSGEINKPKLGL